MLKFLASLNLLRFSQHCCINRILPNRAVYKVTLDSAQPSTDALEQTNQALIGVSQKQPTCALSKNWISSRARNQVENSIRSCCLPSRWSCENSSIRIFMFADKNKTNATSKHRRLVTMRCRQDSLNAHVRIKLCIEWQSRLGAHYSSFGDIAEESMCDFAFWGPQGRFSQKVGRKNRELDEKMLYTPFRSLHAFSFVYYEAE